jgi:hypothetical protein
MSGGAGLTPPESPAAPATNSLDLSPSARAYLNHSTLAPLLELLSTPSGQLKGLCDTKLAHLRALITEREAKLNNEDPIMEGPAPSNPTPPGLKRHISEWRADWRAFKEVELVLGTLLDGEIQSRKPPDKALEVARDFARLVDTGVQGGDLNVLRVMAVTTPDDLRLFLLSKDRFGREMAYADWRFPKHDPRFRALFVESVTLEGRAKGEGAAHLIKGMQELTKGAVRAPSAGDSNHRGGLLRTWARKIWDLLREG